MAKVKGKVSQVIGSVVDFEFPPDKMPALFNAIEVSKNGDSLVLEVQGHIGNNWVRCLSLQPTDGLARGAEAVDTGAPLRVPVGESCLGRLFDVMGQPLDNLGEVKGEDSWEIHRKPPAFDDQETTIETLETGIKVIDLITFFYYF